MKHYDYIFTGAGLSALMTVYKMILSEKFLDKTILLIDENPKKTNDRTWCFWEKPNHQWDNIVSKKWQTAVFANNKASRKLDLQPYEYNMIRGLDFYNLVFDLIQKQSNITFVNDKVQQINEDSSQVQVICESEKFNCNKLFNSIYNKVLLTYLKIYENRSRIPKFFG